jgi:hypothetical protein
VVRRPGRAADRRSGRRRPPHRAGPVRRRRHGRGPARRQRRREPDPPVQPAGARRRRHPSGPDDLGPARRAVVRLRRGGPGRHVRHDGPRDEHRPHGAALPGGQDRQECARAVRAAGRRRGPPRLRHRRVDGCAGDRRVRPGRGQRRPRHRPDRGGAAVVPAGAQGSAPARGHEQRGPGDRGARLGPRADSAVAGPRPGPAERRRPGRCGRRRGAGSPGPARSRRRGGHPAAAGRRPARPRRRRAARLVHRPGRRPGRARCVDGLARRAARRPATSCASRFPAAR